MDADTDQTTDDVELGLTRAVSAIMAEHPFLAYAGSAILTAFEETGHFSQSVLSTDAVRACFCPWQWSRGLYSGLRIGNARISAALANYQHEKVLLPNILYAST